MGEVRAELRRRKPIEAQIQLASLYEARKCKLVTKTEAAIATAQQELADLQASLIEQQRDLAMARKRLSELKAQRALELQPQLSAPPLPPVPPMHWENMFALCNILAQREREDPILQRILVLKRGLLLFLIFRGLFFPVSGP